MGFSGKEISSQKRVENWIKLCLYFSSYKTDFSFSKTVDGIIATSDYEYTECLIKFA